MIDSGSESIVSNKEGRSQDFDIVIFGGAGDLSKRKLFPALFKAFLQGQISTKTAIFPTCLLQEETDTLLASLKAQLLSSFLEPEQNKQVQAFISLIRPVTLDITKHDAKWKKLNAQLAKSDEWPRLFYMAIPPDVFESCCEIAYKNHMIHKNTRLVVEKPIGFDLETAKSINRAMSQYFDEEAIFRIDHYLGKATVQNLLALRFSNTIFEKLWDAASIDHVQISISETVGLENRVAFYNQTGALRDMVQNHLLQLLCLVAMESPNKLNAKNIRAEKIKVLEALRPMDHDMIKTHTVRGQFVAGQMEGQLVPGYLEELGVSASDTETFVALKVHVDNWRWANVPFYLRTGKRLQERAATIVIQFKSVSHQVHQGGVGDVCPNALIIRLQPGESIEMTLMTKDLSSQNNRLTPLSLNLDLSEQYRNRTRTSDAYQRLILDVAANDPSLFIHRDEVFAAWEWIDPIIESWKQLNVTPELYRTGSMGPDKSDQLIANDNRQWFE
ncbi:MAG: glucose-6-phosphate dehydrogenase [Cellvibrionales bacterium]|nr:glucose-6-phosphate dehydrogenase [Cellvibrionales bacterium]